MKNDCIFELIKQRVAGGDTASLTVTGVSMEPLLKNKATVVELCAPIKIKKYDIVLYKRPNGAVVLHRVVKVKKDSLNCRGDAELITEKGVVPSAVAAIAVKALTNGKEQRLQGFSHRMYGRLRVLRRTLLRIFKLKRG